MTHPSGPADWFPGVHTGPRVAIAITRGEVEIIRAMIEDYPQTSGSLYLCERIVRDLDVRVGALDELDAQGDRIPLEFAEHQNLHAAWRDYDRNRFGADAELVRQLFTDLDRRLGAAQIRWVASGENSASDPGAEPLPEPRPAPSTRPDRWWRRKSF